jgi:hypothetical protein
MQAVIDSVASGVPATCVEVAVCDGLRVRYTKDRTGLILNFQNGACLEFITQVKAGTPFHPAVSYRGWSMRSPTSIDGRGSRGSRKGHSGPAGARVTAAIF